MSRDKYPVQDRMPKRRAPTNESIWDLKFTKVKKTTVVVSASICSVLDLDEIENVSHIVIDETSNTYRGAFNALSVAENCI